VSHSNRHTRRRWLVNLQNVKVDLGAGETRRMKICTKCLKSGKVKRAV
ncbi:50S ribosomal protein L28, partial [Aminobacterium colombiense]